VTLLRQPRNTGKGEAVRGGLLEALGQGFKYVGFFDADLSTPLEVVSEFCAIMDRDPQVAMVVGARVRLLGREIERRAIRHYSGRVFATAASLLLNLPVYDTQCGAKLFRATPELKQILHQPFLSRWIFDVEIIARFIRSRRARGAVPVERSIHEVPLRWWKDVRGSKLRFVDFVTAAWDLLRIYWRYLR
jgi:glycosyltransferase involved in cell wall biosynthesis